MTPIGLNRISLKPPTLIIFYFSIGLSCSLLLMAILRRDSTSQEFAIQVGMPRRGNTQRINTMYTARNAMNHNQSGIDFVSFRQHSSLFGKDDLPSLVTERATDVPHVVPGYIC